MRDARRPGARKRGSGAPRSGARGEAIAELVRRELAVRHGVPRKASLPSESLTLRIGSNARVEGSADVSTAPSPRSARLRSFVNALLSDEPVPDSFAHADDLRDELLVPAASLLGEGWRRDAVDFVSVTLATERMAELLLRSPHRFSDGDVAYALLLTTPGDGHVFPLQVLADMLRERGWAVDVRSAAQPHEIRTLSRRLRHAETMPRLLGIGVSTPRLAGRVGEIVRAVRGLPGGQVPIVAGGSAAGIARGTLVESGVDAVLEGGGPALLGSLRERAESAVARTCTRTTTIHAPWTSFVSGVRSRANHPA